jgi:hypothetical protein
MHILRQQAYPNRAVGQTSMNEQSSRSHCLLFVNVAGRNRLNEEVTHSKLVLVDLAGMWADPKIPFLFVVLSHVSRSHA